MNLEGVNELPGGFLGNALFILKICECTLPIYHVQEARGAPPVPPS